MAIIRDAWSEFDDHRPYQPPISEIVRELLAEPLPESGRPPLQVLEEARTVLDQSLAQPRPRWFAFVGSSGLEAGVLADALAATFDINLASWAEAASELEDVALRFVAEFVGLKWHCGAFTSGGSVSNLSALAAARERALPGSRAAGTGGLRAALYCSLDAHHSIVRAAEVLGLGSAQVRTIPVDEDRRMIPDALDEAIARDRKLGIIPVAVVATAGTTLTGAVDPIADVAEVARRHGAWLHVDGAYGLPAAALPSMQNVFAGLNQADSITVDAHKWLYLPKACGLVLVRDPDSLTAAFGHEESYFPHVETSTHSADRTLEYSRPFRALKVWLAFRLHGASAFRAAIERNLGHARLLWSLVRDAADLEAYRPPQLSVVPFRPRVADVDRHTVRLAQALRVDGRVYVAHASIDGAQFLRPCFVNFRTTDEDVEALLSIVREVSAKVR